jgi:subtilisin family serine protease
MRLLTALLLGLALLIIPPACAAEAGRSSYREGELLVQFRPGVPEAARDGMHQRLKGKTLRRMQGDVHHIALPPQVAVEEAVAIYRADPLVRHAEPNYLVRRALLPDDSDFSQQWYLHNTGQRFANNQRGTEGVDIGAPEAWELHTGSGNIIVAVLDSGVDSLHPDLAANIWNNPGEIANGLDSDGNGKIDDLRGWNFVNNNNNIEDNDQASHGTHASGIIGAIGNNARGVSGINWRVQLMPLKFLDADGSGFVAHAIAAIDYAVAHGARVINASYGYPADCTVVPSPSVLERQAIERALQAGVLFVAAAGNSGCNNDLTPFYPASHPVANIIAVAASDPRDSLATFSSYGPTSVHLAAPGVLILSTLRQEAYGYLSGTSMAAPMVSGAAALLFSYRPELPVYAARQYLLESSLRLTEHADKIAYGRLDAAILLDMEETIPLAPQALQADIDQGGVLLAWEDHSLVEAGYELERRDGNLSFQHLAMLPADSIDYFDDGVQQGNTYTYRLRARSELARHSIWSEEVSLAWAAPSVSTVQSASGGGPCFIATAAYGSPLHPKVELLRQFRTEVLLPRWWGRWINDAYLRLSPPLARALEDSELLRQSVRALLRPLIAAVQWWLSPNTSAAVAEPLPIPEQD